MKWLIRIAGVTLALFALLLLMPFFVDIDDYIPEVEKALSARLDQPVSIDNLEASLFPLPHLVADGIRVGSAGEIKVGKVILRPDLWSLAGSTKTLRSVDFEDLTLTSGALSGMLALTRREQGESRLRIEKVRLERAVVTVGKDRFGPFEADISAKREGESEGGALELRTDDGAFKARVTPGGEGYLLEVSARGWTLPMGPAIRFDELDIKGAVNGMRAELQEITGRVYGGTLAGNADVGWDQGVRVKGKLDLKQVELRDAAALVSDRTRVSGKVDAQPVFTASGADASDLLEALRVETPFTVHSGVLHGLDLAAAATLVKRGASAGQTRFDELAGRLVVERRAYRFTQLRIASGSLAARGHLTIGANKALAGELNTTLKGTPAGIPLTVAGTLDAPMIYPNTTAVIGAAAGTAVLGPGLGTAAGAKLGEIADSLLKKIKP